MIIESGALDLLVFLREGAVAEYLVVVEDGAVAVGAGLAVGAGEGGAGEVRAVGAVHLDVGLAFGAGGGGAGDLTSLTVDSQGQSTTGPLSISTRHIQPDTVSLF